jgi:hypothetical protein
VLGIRGSTVKQADKLADHLVSLGLAEVTGRVRRKDERGVPVGEGKEAARRDVVPVDCFLRRKFATTEVAE